MNSDEVEVIKRIKICDNKRFITKSKLTLDLNNTNHSKFYQNLNLGNKIVVWGRCATPAWKCIVKYITLTIVVVNII